MEQQYLADGGVSIVIYIAIAAAGWIWKLYKKQQDKDKENQKKTFYDEQSDSVYEEEYSSQSFNDVLENFSNSLKDELQQPVAVEPEPMVNSLEELQNKYGAETIVEEKKSNRFEDYKIEEEKKNTFGDLLDDTENFKKAFILSQILEKKY